jgi:cytidine deaminase
MELHKLIKLAIAARENAYSPYSQKKLGAAILLDTGEVYCGCNIENASYGATVCAERVALWKALSEKPQSKVKLVVVCSDEETPWPPCGMCRQVLAEFCTMDCEVLSINLNNQQRRSFMKDLFPEGFGPQNLLK